MTEYKNEKLIWYQITYAIKYPNREMECKTTRLLAHGLLEAMVQADTMVNKRNEDDEGRYIIFGIEGEVPEDFG